MRAIELFSQYSSKKPFYTRSGNELKPWERKYILKIPHAKKKVFI